MLAPLVLTLLLAFTPTASANHLWATSLDHPDILAIAPENRIDILGLCLSGETELSYPADTGFFVYTGWAFLWAGPFWDGPAPPEFRRAAISSTSTFELLIDDELQRPSSHAPAFTSRQSDFAGIDELWKAKLFVIEHHQGLSRTHVFTGMWSLDGSIVGGEFGEQVLILACDLTVDFVS